MRDIIKRIFYRTLLFFEQKTANARIYYNSKLVTLGQGAELYSKCKIYNFRKDPALILVGNNSHIKGELLVMNYGGKIEIGRYSFVGEGSRIWSGHSVIIGSNVLISHNVNITDTNSHELNHTDRALGFKEILITGQPCEKGSILTAPVVIEDDVWVSFNVTILKGVTIGRGAILAANSVVTKDVSPFSLVAGCPAKFVRFLQDEHKPVN